MIELAHSYLESENLVHFPPKELSNDFTGLVFSYLQSLYFRSNPCILGSILVFSHSIPLLQIQSLYFLIQFPYFVFNPCTFSFNSLTLDSILVLSHSIPLLQIQSLYFRFNPCISFAKFSLSNRNVSSIIWQFQDGKNSLFVSQGTF